MMPHGDQPIGTPSGYTEYMALAISEVTLILRIRELGHGKLCIKVQGGRPVMIEREVQQIRL
jgi:hypothetical protein